MIGILLLAAALRLLPPGSAPPGIHQDEAANAWNAWCILHTGMDQAGAQWPIFYTRALGENRSTLFVYWMMPCQLIGGLNVFTMRAPAAAAGILSVLLTYLILRRAVSPTAGVIGALLMAIAPWHVQHTRWGHEASFCPLAVCAALWACGWAGLPILRSAAATAETVPLWRSVVAGLLTGLICYGYPAIRLFVPVLLLAIACVSLPDCLRMMRNGAGLRRLAGFALGLAVTFGPLAWVHATDGQAINKRGNTTWVWGTRESVVECVGLVALRYFEHFDPVFLLTRGDNFATIGPAVGGQIPWYFALLLIVGAGTAVAAWRSSSTARALLVGLVLFPISDILNANDGPSALRSFPGVVPLVLLAAFGAARWAQWWWSRRRIYVELLAAWMLLEAGWWGWWFYGDFDQRDKIQRTYHVALVDACRSLGDELNSADAVFVTADEKLVNMPYVVMLVAMNYDPQRWQAERVAGRIDIQEIGVWDYCFRFGNVYFLYPPAPHDPRLGGTHYLTAMRSDEARQRAIFIVPPTEFRSMTPDAEIRDAAGEVQLVIIRAEI
ncbi:MAG: hypothetical protein IPM64_13605 [Phycisphaerales bacterium]|nr:hypothetical protein [Phycisphaerales bacterium]